MESVLLFVIASVLWTAWTALVAWVASIAWAAVAVDLGAPPLAFRQVWLVIVAIVLLVGLFRSAGSKKG